MGIRLRQHQDTAHKLINWLSKRREVSTILYPAWPKDPGYKIWKRDFTGASGLFGVLLKPIKEAALARLIEGMAHFRIGASWGGYESLIIPAKPIRCLPNPSFNNRGVLLRIHAGLEDPRDLIEDLKQGFSRLV